MDLERNIERLQTVQSNKKKCGHCLRLIIALLKISDICYRGTEDFFVRRQNYLIFVRQYRATKNCDLIQQATGIERGDWLQKWKYMSQNISTMHCNDTNATSCNIVSVYCVLHDLYSSNEFSFEVDVSFEQKPLTAHNKSTINMTKNINNICEQNAGKTFIADIIAKPVSSMDLPEEGSEIICVRTNTLERNVYSAFDQCLHASKLLMYYQIDRNNYWRTVLLKREWLVGVQIQDQLLLPTPVTDLEYFHLLDLCYVGIPKRPSIF